MNLATAYVEVKGDVSTLKPTVAKAAQEAGHAAGDALDKEIEGGIKKGATKGRTTLQGLTDVFKGALFVGGIKTAIDAASDLNETVSKSQVVFGDQAKAIQAFGDTAAKSLGQSKQQAIDAASSFAIFGKSAGLTGEDLTGFATKLTTLSGDLASFSNTSPEDAIVALSAALRGESEPIRAYGVLLDDASLRQEAMKQGLIATTKDALTPQQRVLAAYQLILQQTTDAQGDFARTADGAANSQRIAAAEAKDAAATFGDNLLPIYTRAVQLVGVLAEGFGALPAPIQLGVVALAGVVAFSGPISQMISLVQQIGPAIAKAAAAFVGFAAANPILLGLVAVAAAATAALIIFGGQESATEKTAKSLNQAMRDTAGGFDEQALRAAAASGSLGDFATKLQEVLDKQIKAKIEGRNQVDDLGRLGISYQNLSKLTGSQAEREAELTDARTKLIGSGELFIASTADLNHAANLTAEAQAKLTDEYVRTGKIAPQVVEGQNLMLSGNTGLNDSFNELAGGTEKATEKLIEQAAAGDASAAKALQARGEYGLLTDAQKKTADAALGVADAQGKAGDATGKTAVQVGQMSTAYEDLSKQTGSMKDQFDEAAKAAEEFGKALDALTGGAISLDTATSDAIANQQGLQAAFLDARKEMEGNVTTLDQYTDAGRANRDVIKESIDKELAYADAFVKSGGSQQEASTKLEQYRQNLIDQAVQSGLSRDEVEEYIKTLGLTPENVDTAIALSNEEAAKNQVDAWIKRLDNDIPKDTKTAIQALIDEGQYEAAKARLQALEATRYVYYNAIVNKGDFVGPAGGLPGTASGRYVDRRITTTMGEDGPEVALNQGQAAKILWQMANGAGPVGKPSGQIVINNTFYGDINGVDEFDRRLDERDRQLAAALGAS